MLCLCASLFACSDDKDSVPTHAELCAGGPSVQCLIGKWKLESIERNGAFVESVSNAMLILSNDDGEMWYEFSSDRISHEGTWQLNVADKTINLGCFYGDCLIYNIEDFKVELDLKGDVLRVHGSPFYDYAPSSSVEKYIFRP